MMPNVECLRIYVSVSFRTAPCSLYVIESTNMILLLMKSEEEQMASDNDPV